MTLKGKTVFITGASSGIGRACAKEFSKQGARLLLCARRVDKLQTLCDELQAYQVDTHYFQLDVCDRQAVLQALNNLPKNWNDIDILINNAGLALGLEKVYAGDVDDWERMIDTNIKGLLYVSRFVVGQMVKRNQGHIINIGSISSHQVYSGGVVYCATKFAVKAISEGLKMDVHGTPIRVTSIDPGMVQTEFSSTRFKGDQQKADTIYAGMTPLTGKDIAEAVVFCATRPAHVDVREMIIMPTDQTATHLCHRE